MYTQDIYTPSVKKNTAWRITWHMSPWRSPWHIAWHIGICHAGVSMTYPGVLICHVDYFKERVKVSAWRSPWHMTVTMTYQMTYQMTGQHDSTPIWHIAWQFSAFDTAMTYVPCHHDISLLGVCICHAICHGDICHVICHGDTRHMSWWPSWWQSRIQYMTWLTV